MITFFHCHIKCIYLLPVQPQPQVMVQTSPKAAEPEDDNTLVNLDVFEDTTETVVSSTTVDVNDKLVYHKVNVMSKL